MGNVMLNSFISVMLTWCKINLFFLSNCQTASYCSNASSHSVDHHFFFLAGKWWKTTQTILWINQMKSYLIESDLEPWLLIPPKQPPRKGCFQSWGVTDSGVPVFRRCTVVFLRQIWVNIFTFFKFLYVILFIRKSQEFCSSDANLTLALPAGTMLEVQCGVMGQG